MTELWSAKKLTTRSFSFSIVSSDPQSHHNIACHQIHKPMKNFSTICQKEMVQNWLARIDRNIRSIEVKFTKKSYKYYIASYSPVYSGFWLLIFPIKTEWNEMLTLSREYLKYKSYMAPIATFAPFSGVEIISFKLTLKIDKRTNFEVIYN